MNGPDDNIAPLGKPNGGGGGYYGQARPDLYIKFHEMDKRLVRIEEQLKHVATKTWILTGVITAIITAAILALAVLKLFDN